MGGPPALLAFDAAAELACHVSEYVGASHNLDKLHPLVSCGRLGQDQNEAQNHNR